MTQRNCIAMSVVLVVLVLASRAHGFLLDTVHTNLDPCTYSRSTIECSSHGLTSIPVFNLTGYTDDCSVMIDLFDNKLFAIGNDAFFSLLSLNCSLSIIFRDNNISQINEYAFRGIETQIVRLYLDGNNLHALPEAIGSLINLQLLHLENNPMTLLNPSVMAKVGHSLKTFGVSMSLFQQWPTELHFLNDLQYLTIDYIPFRYLESSAFRGLTNVEIVAMRFTHFTRIPNALCSLSDLKTLYLAYNYFLNESKSNVFEPCTRSNGTSKVEKISYNSNNVDFFPNILTMFPSVKYLDMQYNGMRFMNADKIEENFSVLTLQLSHNKLRQIPSGVNNLKNLEVLRLEENLIEFVEDNALIGLRNLAYIDLQSNPIQFITNRAFQNNMKLTHVLLSNTFLTTIPAAVSVLPTLQFLFLETTNIECTCDLVSLKNWNVSSIRIDGQCYQTTERIDHFLKTYIDADRC